MLLSLADGCLHRADGARFDPALHAWVPGAVAAGRPLAPTEAAAWLLRGGGGRRLPVAIVGPREATPTEAAQAEAVAAALAGHGFPLLCGGREGAMAAAARGCAAAGGLMIGVLPSTDWREANPHVAIPLATGLGEARNSVIASAGFALVAVGGGGEPYSYGTASEMAFGLRLGRLVLALPGSPALPGVLACADAEAACARVATRYLGLD